MILHNETPFVADYFIGPRPGADRTFEASAVVVVKATFSLPGPTNARVERAPEQHPLLSSDEYYRGDVTGSVYQESDLVPFKPRADIVLFGTAHAPSDRPVSMLDVSLRVGALRKTIRVIGDRHWAFPNRLVRHPVMSEAVPFTAMPLLDERAFGGYSLKGADWCLENLIGQGIAGKKPTRALWEEAPLPNLEDPGQLIRSWDDRPSPTGFGWRRKDTVPRLGFLGTPTDPEHLDATWALPRDFRFDYYNGAHPDLQVPGYLHGNEEVELRHLTPEGLVRFGLPGITPAIRVAPSGEADGFHESVTPVLDTLVFLPDEGLFYQVWRSAFPTHTLGDHDQAVVTVSLGTP